MGGQIDPLGIVQEMKFYHACKLYMQNPESDLENGSHKLLWDFEIEKKTQNKRITYSRPDDQTSWQLTKKKKNKNLKNCQLCCSGL